VIAGKNGSPSGSPSPAAPRLVPVWSAAFPEHLTGEGAVVDPDSPVIPLVTELREMHVRMPISVTDRSLLPPGVDREDRHHPRSRERRGALRTNSQGDAMTRPSLSGRRGPEVPGRVGPPAVASIPARHPYVGACTALVVDPQPDRIAPSAAPWAPDPLLDPAGPDRAAPAIDVLHLHFGYETWTPPVARRWVQVLRAHRVPLFLTVHDLRNPHQQSARPHDALLDVLVPAAHRVLTLTPGAAAAIERRWRRRALVVPHPPVAEPGRAPARTSPGGLAGIHLKSLRRNVVEPLTTVAAAAEGARRAGGRLRVDAHPDALGPADHEALGRMSRTMPVRVQIHERFDDEALLAYLAGLDVSVLPYRFGTHSGWLEACRDVGTDVVAPSCGHYAEQWDRVLTYPHDERLGLDGEGLAEAVAAALRRPGPGPAPVTDRAAVLDRLQALHAELYAQAAASRRAAVA